MEKSKLQGSAADNIVTEIKLMKLLKHEYIVQMRDFSWDDRFIYIILEYCDGGDLSCFIKKRRKLPEATCRKFLQQLAQALQYLRNNNVCHMDLKPQNLLLSTKPVLRLKLADFGFSQFLSMEERRNTLRGSPLYMAPEMLLLQDYDATVDLWSVGVIMYECLFSKAPYSSSNVLELTEKIKLQKAIEIPPNSGISSECRDLLMRLLQHDPKQRISFEEFFSHAYLDLEHIPGPQSYEKAVQIVCDAVQCDRERNFVDAFNHYCEALRYFVPLIQSETDVKKRNALRAKVNDYITRAENLKKYIYLEDSGKENNKPNDKTVANITTGAAFRELSKFKQEKNQIPFSLIDMLCANNPELCEVLEQGCNAEQDNAEGHYRLALDKYQNCIRVMMTVLNQEPSGRRRDLLLNQVSIKTFPKTMDS